MLFIRNSENSARESKLSAVFSVELHPINVFLEINWFLGDNSAPRDKILESFIHFGCASRVGGQPLLTAQPHHSACQTSHHFTGLNESHDFSKVRQTYFIFHVRFIDKLQHCTRGVSRPVGQEPNPEIVGLCAVACLLKFEFHTRIGACWNLSLILKLKFKPPVLLAGSDGSA